MKPFQQVAEVKADPEFSSVSLDAAESQPSSESQYESDLGIVQNSSGQRNHPSRHSEDDIILRIECITERQMKVKPVLESCSHCKSRDVVGRAHVPSRMAILTPCQIYAELPDSLCSCSSMGANALPLDACSKSLSNRTSLDPLSQGHVSICSCRNPQK